VKYFLILLFLATSAAADPGTVNWVKPNGSTTLALFPGQEARVEFASTGSQASAVLDVRSSRALFCFDRDALSAGGVSRAALFRALNNPATTNGSQRVAGLRGDSLGNCEILYRGRFWVEMTEPAALGEVPAVYAIAAE
jgi:hypothetical protein